MEKWLKDAREKVKGEAEMALWSCKRLAETESLEKDWSRELKVSRQTLRKWENESNGENAIERAIQRRK